MGYPGALYIMITSVVSSLFCEGVLWVLVYRTSSYQNLREVLDRTTKKGAFSRPAAPGWSGSPLKQHIVYICGECTPGDVS
eukprot:6076529-Pyramimonas_sp.AAC.2